MAVLKKEYGIADNKTVNAYIITSDSGESAQLIEKGATLDKLFIKDKNGKLIDILSGHDTLDGHINRSDYQGVVVGQYANRIKLGKFSIDGVEYQVTCNDNEVNSLHGGDDFSDAIWQGEIVDDYSVKFSYTSPHLKEGFPGNVQVEVVYTFNNSELSIKYKAIPDRKTIINLTNHAYFNLNGYEDTSILDHTICINADYYTPIDELSIPTGELLPVEGTPFDFTAPKTIGRDIDADHIQLKNGNGYDHNFCLNGFNGELQNVAYAIGDKSGIRMDVKTNLPGMQLYTGNFLNGTVEGKGELPIKFRSAFCFETQVYPDTPNHPEWPGCTYDAGEEYNTETIFAFKVNN